MANVAEIFRVVARRAPGDAVDEADGLITIASRIPLPHFNPAFVTCSPADPEIRILRDPAALQGYHDTLTAGYGLPREVLAVFAGPAALNGWAEGGARRCDRHGVAGHGNLHL